MAVTMQPPSVVRALWHSLIELFTHKAPVAHTGNSNRINTLLVNWNNSAFE